MKFNHIDNKEKNTPPTSIYRLYHVPTGKCLFKSDKVHQFWNMYDQYEKERELNPELPKITEFNNEELWSWTYEGTVKK